jgi:hypothetical protein
MENFLKEGLKLRKLSFRDFLNIDTYNYILNNLSSIFYILSSGLLIPFHFL